jgi:hypothetical protein
MRRLIPRNVNFLIVPLLGAFGFLTGAEATPIQERLEWANFLEPDHQFYFLNRDLFLEKSSQNPEDLLQIPAGTELEAVSVDPLDSIKVVLFEFYIKDCRAQDSAPSSEITIVHPVGVLLERKCVLTVFVEFKNLYDESFFFKNRGNAPDISARH